jgi:cob(I)alamin adenosyltransferase
MKIYTKGGDAGETSLLGGTRVSKADLRIEAYGTVDEVNSYLGLIRDVQEDEHRKEILKEIQDRLFTIGSSLAADPNGVNIQKPDLLDVDIQVIEVEIDRMESGLPPLKNFILPGGHQYVSFCHIARCVCRRAERATIRLGEENKVDPLIVKYLNRLSDYLFVLSRVMSLELGAAEVVWKPRQQKDN